MVSGSYVGWRAGPVLPPHLLSTRGGPRGRSTSPTCPTWDPEHSRLCACSSHFLVLSYTSFKAHPGRPFSPLRGSPLASATRTVPPT